MAFRMVHLSFLRRFILRIIYAVYTKLFSMDIHRTCSFSLSAKFDKTNPRGVHVGEYSYIAFGAVILTHDLTRGVRLHTRVGKNCFIGGRSIIMPGVTIGDCSIVGAGSVVVKDVPPFTIVAGNPAKVIRQGIEVGRYGRLKGADETQRTQAVLNNLD